MSAGENLNPGQFRFRGEDGTQYDFSHVNKWDANEHAVTATREGEQVGEMGYKRSGGSVGFIHVQEEHRRTGVGRGMWAVARAMHDLLGTAEPEHSHTRSDTGDAWAKSVGGYLPQRSGRHS